MDLRMDDKTKDHQWIHGQMLTLSGPGYRKLLLDSQESNEPAQKAEGWGQLRVRSSHAGQGATDKSS